jgi:hypothetical protein
LVAAKAATTPAVRLRERGLIDARAARDVQHVARIESDVYRLGFQLMALAAVLRGCWTDTSADGVLIERQLTEAELLSDQLMLLFSEQNRAEADHTERKAEQRQRNFTLLMRAYTQVRRAIGYVRFEHGDPTASRHRVRVRCL